jgi:hypothetical protein
MNTQPNAKGRRFHELLQASPYQANEFAAALGVSNPQNVTHWYKRGVPSPLAHVAADLLGCSADEISKVVSKTTSDPKQVAVRRLKREIKEKIASLLESTDELSTLELMNSQIDAYQRLTDR